MSPATPPPEQFVFVMAYGRSGSTLIQALLNALPDTCIRGENGGALNGLHASWRRIAHTAQLEGARGGPATAPDTPWFGAEATEPRGYARALGAAFTRHVLAPPPGTRRAGCKEIRFHEGPGGWSDVLPFEGPGGFRDLLDFLTSAFPDARFVLNSRDREAVARSGWWRQVPQPRMVEVLGRIDALFDQAAEAFPDRAIRLRYDDYAGHPDGFAPLFAHLGLPFDRDLAARVLAKPLGHSGV
ncbi:sulfotransferase [Palleronia sp. LCG004]|uniref:sulfotransferase n=1 Tax=Palleronia sp. LCG004 TaxID=3079304 RepID=UPI00294213B5|nr:sulfotransferase [Palleronia sp. LCG004]WOI58361.1 sulfotransferase [Palleronia sp. LCG004]